MGYVIATIGEGRKVAFDYGLFGSRAWREHLEHGVEKVFKLPCEHRHFLLNKDNYVIIGKNEWIWHGMLKHLDPQRYIKELSELS